jgi:hypothetical protein
MEEGIQRYRSHLLECDERETKVAEERRQDLLAKQALDNTKNKRGGLRSALAKKP